MTMSVRSPLASPRRDWLDKLNERRTAFSPEDVRVTSSRHRASARRGKGLAASGVRGRRGVAPALAGGGREAGRDHRAEGWYGERAAAQGLLARVPGGAASGRWHVELTEGAAVVGGPLNEMHRMCTASRENQKCT